MIRLFVLLSVCAYGYTYVVTNSTSHCLHDKFDCQDGSCIPTNWRCDNETDCKNGIDEENCEQLTCFSTQFQCTSARSCIPHRWRCDGEIDCADKSDEQNCETTTKMMPTTERTTTTERLSTTELKPSVGTASTTTSGSSVTNVKPSVGTASTTIKSQSHQMSPDPSCKDEQPSCNVLVQDIDICSKAAASLLCASTCHMCGGGSNSGHTAGASTDTPGFGVTASTTTTPPPTTTTRLTHSSHEPYTTPKPGPSGSGSCVDVEDNCAFMVTSVDICNKPNEAAFLCPATCQMCGSP